MDTSDARVDFPIDIEALTRRCRMYAARCDGLTDVAPLSASLSAQVLCALDGWLSANAGDELSSDPEHAAADALRTIERSRQAWLAMVKSREVRAISAASSVADLVWLKYEIGRAFPNAAA
jgi:hypothetical protein